MLSNRLAAILLTGILSVVLGHRSDCPSRLSNLQACFDAGHEVCGGENYKHYVEADMQIKIHKFLKCLNVTHFHSEKTNCPPPFDSRCSNQRILGDVCRLFVLADMPDGRWPGDGYPPSYFQPCLPFMIEKLPIDSSHGGVCLFNQAQLCMIKHKEEIAANVDCDPGEKPPAECDPAIVAGMDGCAAEVNQGWDHDGHTWKDPSVSKDWKRKLKAAYGNGDDAVDASLRLGK